MSCYISSMLIPLLFSGAHASVRLAFDTKARRQVACKSIYRRNGVWKKSVEDLMQEVHVLRQLQHVCALTPMCIFS